MIENPVRAFSSLTVSTFERPIAEVWRGMQGIFAAYGIDMAQRPGPLNYERYGPDPNPGARGQRRGALLAHGDATLMLTNMVDGWMTLATRTSLELRCRCWQFTVCQDVPYPRNAFQLMEAGVTRRLVSVMLDSTRWDFAERGEPLPFESIARYGARRVRDRLTRDDVLAIAASAGFPIGDDGLWRSDATSIAFEERRQS